MKEFICPGRYFFGRLNSAVPFFIVIALLFGSCKESRKEPEYKSVPLEKMTSNSNLKNINMTSLVSLTDTICGMSIKDGVADTLVVGSFIYGFCSEGCKRKFKDNLGLQ